MRLTLLASDFSQFLYVKLMTKMSQFAGLITKINFFAKKLRINLSLDFGSSQTRLMINHQLVWHQPTLIAWHTRLQSVVAVGDQAAALRGKMPAQVKLIAPIHKGVVVELDYAVFYLQAVLAQLQQQRKLSSWIVANCRVAVPAHVSPLEKDQLRQVLDRVGLKVNQIVSQTEAVIRLPMFKKITQNHGVIDFGAQTVNVGIFTGQQLFRELAVSDITGDVFTQAIIDRALAKYELHISWEVAQQLKHQLSVSTVMTIKGKDARTQLVKIVKVEAAKFTAQFNELMRALLLELKEFIDELPPEVAIQLQEQGFYFTGAGAALSGWQDLASQLWQMPVITSLSPALDVVKGLDYDK